jgi:hypothetical protein
MEEDKRSKGIVKARKHGKREQRKAETKMKKERERKTD